MINYDVKIEDMVIINEGKYALNDPSTSAVSYSPYYNFLVSERDWRVFTPDILVEHDGAKFVNSSGEEIKVNENYAIKIFYKLVASCAEHLFTGTTVNGFSRRAYGMNSFINTVTTANYMVRDFSIGNVVSPTVTLLSKEQVTNGITGRLGEDINMGNHEPLTLDYPTDEELGKNLISDLYEGEIFSDNKSFWENWIRDYNLPFDISNVNRRSIGSRYNTITVTLDDKIMPYYESSTYVVPPFFIPFICSNNYSVKLDGNNNYVADEYATALLMIFGVCKLPEVS